MGNQRVIQWAPPLTRIRSPPLSEVSLVEFTDTPLAPDCTRVFASGVHVAVGVGLGNSCFDGDVLCGLLRRPYAPDDAELRCCCQEMGASALRSRLPGAQPSPAEGKVQRVRP